MYGICKEGTLFFARIPVFIHWQKWHVRETLLTAQGAVVHPGSAPSADPIEDGRAVELGGGKPERRDSSAGPAHPPPSTHPRPFGILSACTRPRASWA